MRMKAVAVLIVFSFVLWGSLEAKNDGKGKLDDFNTLMAMRWNMDRKKVENLFGKHIPQEGILYHTRGFLDGEEAILYFQFDRETGNVVQTNMALPVGEFTEEEMVTKFEQIENKIIKKYGNATHKMRGAQADKMFTGLMAYDAWARKDVEILLLLDTNQERLHQMASVIKDEELRNEIESWQGKRNAVIGIVFRRPGLVE